MSFAAIIFVRTDSFTSCHLSKVIERYLRDASCNRDLSAHRVLLQDRGPFRSFECNARGIPISREHIESPVSKLPLGVVIVA